MGLSVPVLQSDIDLVTEGLGRREEKVISSNNCVNMCLDTLIRESLITAVKSCQSVSM